jgi:hypothetical protein
VLERKVTMSELALIAGTRVALGIGLGLMLAARLNNDERRAAGAALAIIGALSTIPLAVGIIKRESPIRGFREAA